MHVVRLPYPDGYILALQLAVDEHQQRVREEYQKTGATTLGRVAMLCIVGPDQELVPGVSNAVAGKGQSEQDHPLYLALLRRDLGKLAAAHLEFSFGPEIVPEQHQGLVLLYDRAGDMDAVHDRAHVLAGQTLDTTAAERRALTIAGADPNMTYAALSLPYGHAA